ncbi:MAG TPA: ABC transporter permease [Terriglobales bacterium]|nr:ABC transporter permease [Terriglobales bacterium]
MLLEEIHHALRLLARNRALTLIAALSLGLGIGANSAMFSMADALFLRPLPIHNPSEVVVVATDSPQGGTMVSFPDYRDFRDKSRSFDGLVALAISTFSVARSSKDVPEMRAGVAVTDNFFSVLGVQPALGRAFLPEEGQVAGRDAVMVVSEDFWRSELGADRSFVGRSLRINGIDFTVVGVAPASFTGVDQYLRPSFYVPIMMLQQLNGATENPLEKRGDHSFQVKGRLKEGVTRQQAQAELATIWKALQQQYPDTDRNRTVAVRTEVEDRYVQDTIDAQLIGMLMALVGVVLIIACANVANLLLGQTRARTREIAIRLALGISGPRLLRQLLVESLLLALAGCTLGLVFAYGGIRFLQTLEVPTDLPIVIHPVLDARVLMFSLACALLSALVCGLVPAWKSFKVELVPALKSAESSLKVRHRTWGRDLLVVGQVALSLVLLVATGMLLDGFRKTLLSSPGFRTDHLLMTEFDTSMVRYTPAQTHDFYRSLVDHARALPGVRNVSLTEVVPFAPGQANFDVVPEGYQFPKGQENTSLLGSVVDENYFSVMNTPIISGRTFNANDKEGTPLVVVVNEQFAKTYWPNQDPIGKRLRLAADKDKWRMVVGVAKTGKYIFISENPQPFLYLPLAQDQQTRMVLLTETSADPAVLAGPVREIVHTLDANQPVFNMRTMSSFYHTRAVSTPLFIMEIVAAMGMMGLTLALIGLYGLVAYSVARRTREIGVRMAIGARRADVLVMVLKQGLTLSLAGIAIGGLVTAAAVRVLASGLLGLATPNLPTFALVPVLLLVATLISCYVPAYRASRVDPMLALRYE